MSRGVSVPGSPPGSGDSGAASGIPQRAQYPLSKEYGLNHNMTLKPYSLIKGYWALWVHPQSLLGRVRTVRHPTQATHSATIFLNNFSACLTSRNSCVRSIGASTPLQSEDATLLLQGSPLPTHRTLSGAVVGTVCLYGSGDLCEDSPDLNSTCSCACFRLWSLAFTASVAAECIPSRHTCSSAGAS